MRPAIRRSGAAGRYRRWRGVSTPGRPLTQLLGADPLTSAVGELLVLPDGHLCLDVVDQPAAGVEGFFAVSRSGRDDDRGVADLQVADAVQRGHPPDRAARAG